MLVMTRSHGCLGRLNEDAIGYAFVLWAISDSKTNHVISEAAVRLKVA